MPGSRDRSCNGFPLDPEHAMKAFTLVATISALVATVAKPTFAQGTPASDEQIRSMALRIMGLETRRQLASATTATIDSLLTAYADDVVYEHPNAGAVIRGKALMRRNMAQYLGSIRAVAADTPRVIVGNGVAIVESNMRMEIEDAGKWVPVTRHSIRVIEFDPDGLVRRIIDYPW